MFKEKYAHNVTQYRVLNTKESYDDVFTISRTTEVGIYCYLMLEIDILLNLSSRDCMYVITSIIKNSEECSTA